MTTKLIETFGEIRADGTLELDQKLAGAPRRVKVRVEDIEVESDEDFAVRFERLNGKLKEDNRFSSRLKTTLQHPAFREIVAMGMRAVPLLLADLEKNGGFGFLALEEITGIDPMPGRSNVKIDETQAAWIAWGRTQGYGCSNAV